VARTVYRLGRVAIAALCADETKRAERHVATTGSDYRRMVGARLVAARFALDD
jgi:hypothetical protein